jgi:hypothetical protein
MLEKFYNYEKIVVLIILYTHILKLEILGCDRSQFRQPPLQVVDDDVLEVVDVLLIGINSWWIHPL